MAPVGGQTLASKYSSYEHAISNSQVKTNPRRAKRLVNYLINRSRTPYHHGKVLGLTKNHAPFLYGINLMKKLPVHQGCVNTICWNKTGEYILSGSDDDYLCITKPTYMFDNSKDYTVLHKVQTQHEGNIFRAQFIPNSNDHKIVSCSSGGPVIVHDINSANPSIGLFNFNCHSSTIFEVATLPDDESVFLSCGEDKTVRLFDMRCHKSCAAASTCPHPALIRNSYAMTTLSVHPSNTNLLLVGRADGLGLVYDRRKLPNPSEFSREKAHMEYKANLEEGRAQLSTFRCLHPLEGVVSQFNVPDMTDKYRFTSLSYSADGRQVLASYSQDYIYLFDHDKSSNFNLIQTLPVKTALTKDTENTSQSEDNQSETRQSVRRTPRIRVRGDWSDTGINSVPNSLRSDTSSSRNASSILQRMTEVAFYAGPRHISVTELLGSLLDHSNNRNNLSSEGNDRDNEQGERNLEDAGAGDGDDDVNNDHEEDDDDDDDDEEEEEDSNSDGDVITATFELSVRGGSNDEEDKDDSNDKHLSQNQKPANGGTGKPKISSQTINKFKETFASLKDKFNSIPTHHPKVKYQGHRNSKTTIKKAIFWGDDYIMSGSDCGRVMIWEKETAKLVMGFPADERVVNCLAPNPHQYVLASSGIDYDIKLWSTQNIVDCPLKLTEQEMGSIVRNNELMLEEAKETIIVSPHLFFRVLASFARNNSLDGVFGIR